MIVSHETMKKQAVYNKQVCYIFTHRTTLKLINTQKSRRERNRLVIKDLARLSMLQRTMYMESVNQQCRELVQLILITSHCKFYGAHMCSHAQKTISLAPIRLFTKQIVPFVVSRIVDLKFVEIIFTSFSYSMCLIRCFLPSKHFYVNVFFLNFVSFSLHTFHRLTGVT